MSKKYRAPDWSELERKEFYYREEHDYARAVTRLHTEARQWAASLASLGRWSSTAQASERGPAT
jgi:hypothetical protein